MRRYIFISLITFLLLACNTQFRVADNLYQHYNGLYDIRLVPADDVKIYFENLKNISIDNIDLQKMTPIKVDPTRRFLFFGREVFDGIIKVKPGGHTIKVDVWTCMGCRPSSIGLSCGSHKFEAGRAYTIKVDDDALSELRQGGGGRVLLNKVNCWVDRK